MVHFNERNVMSRTQIKAERYSTEYTFTLYDEPEGMMVTNCCDFTFGHDGICGEICIKPTRGCKNYTGTVAMMIENGEVVVKIFDSPDGDASYTHVFSKRS